MRLVSRYGIVDIPYENAQLFLQGTIVIADCFGKEYTMAKYSTADKALKVMEMVREKSFWNKDVFQFPKDEEVEI